jgi:twitching motility protein PilT
LLQKMNMERELHMVTVEDPIEYVFLNEKSVIEQREVGRDAESMLSALELADREDVDVIFVSGMKIPEVIHKTIELASSDRLVFASFSADSIIHGFDNIIASYPQEARAGAQRMLSETLQAALGQRLLPRIGGGLIVIPELLIPNTPARALIRDGVFEQLKNIMQTSREQGMVSLDSILLDYVRSGVITADDAKAYASDPDQFGYIARQTE